MYPPSSEARRRPPEGGRAARSELRGWRARAASGLALALSLGPIVAAPACLCPPSVEDVASLGFRSPEMTFHSFQTAVRADSPLVEYRCLGYEFCAANRISHLTWREYRDELFSDNPFLARGIADAEIVSNEHQGKLHARIVAESHGHRFEVLFVREAFYQIWVGEELIGDDLLPDQHDLVGTVIDSEPDGPGRRLVYSSTGIDESGWSEHLTEYRVAFEWKINGIQMLEEDSDTPSSGLQP